MFKNVVAMFFTTFSVIAACGSDKTMAAPANKPSTSKAPVIILKLDDVYWGNAKSAVPAQWQRIADYIEKNNLKASFGILCCALEIDNPTYINWIKEHQKKGVIEFWCHGYRVRKDQKEPGEFEQGTFEEQKAILEKCQKIAKEKLGFEFAAFGAHWSGTTEETEKAIQAIPGFKIWFCEFYAGQRRPKFFKKVALERYMGGLEYPTFVPNFEKFKTDYEKFGADKNMLALQGHAGKWDDVRWENFVKIIEFLKSNGCVFMTPSEYYASLKGTTQPQN